MPRFHPRLRAVVVGASAIALVAIGVGGTVAASNPATLYACYDVNGNVRITDANTCKLPGGGRLASWGTTGTPGPVGATGVAGVTGTTGAQGDPGVGAHTRRIVVTAETFPFPHAVRIASGTGFTVDATCILVAGFPSSSGYQITVPAGATEPLITSFVLINGTLVNSAQSSVAVGTTSSGSFSGQLTLMVANSTGGARLVLEPFGYTPQGDCVYALTS